MQIGKKKREQLNGKCAAIGQLKCTAAAHMHKKTKEIEVQKTYFFLRNLQKWLSINEKDYIRIMGEVQNRKYQREQ